MGYWACEEMVMNEKKVATELVRLARELTGGTWGLPGNSRDVAAILKIYKKMRAGAYEGIPSKDLYSLLGNDSLFDEFDRARDAYNEECADAIKRMVKKLVSMGPETFADKAEYDALVELQGKL